MIFFAPMQGYTIAAFRAAHFCTIGRIKEYYTPFLRLEKNCFRDKDLTDIKPESNKNIPLVPQILVRTPDESIRLISEIAEYGYRRIDFNFCCPFVKVTEKGYGAAMLQQPDMIRSVLKTTGQFPEIIFSAKLRLPVMALIPVFKDFPLCHVTLHPRYAEQDYDDPIDMTAFHGFADKSPVPVVLNGNITTSSGCRQWKDVMIGRGLLANPLLSLDEPENHTDKLVRFHDELVKRMMNESGGFDFLKRYWQIFLPDAEKRLRKKIQKSRCLEEYTEYADAIFKHIL